MKPYQLLIILPAIILPARALEMVFESRSVLASYYGGGLELRSSTGNFGAFDATATGIPFGGGSVTASQHSTITSSGFDLQHNITDFFGPGGRAESNFQFVFRLDQPKTIAITGYSFFFSGPASLMSESGPIPLVWGPDTLYRNYLDFSQVLGPGLYTFTSNEWLRGDGINTHITMREEPPRAGGSNVPDSGSTAVLMGLGLVGLAAMRRKNHD